METDVSEEPATSAFRVKAVKAFDIIYFKCAYNEIPEYYNLNCKCITNTQRNKNNISIQKINELQTGAFKRKSSGC
jgi:hypothetical protein